MEQRRTAKSQAAQGLRPLPCKEEMRQKRTDCARRLENLAGLRIRLEKARKRLSELEEGGLAMRQMAVARFQRSGVRLSEEQIYQALVKDLKARIAGDAYELALIEEALQSIEGDRYYPCVHDRFVLGMEDGEIAASLYCDESTVRKNRVRLMNTLCLILC